MDTITIVIIAILLIALFFFGITIFSGSNNSKSSGYSSYQPSYAGGGCGRG